MIRITADVFSGRPNPSWIVTDEAEVRAILREAGAQRASLSAEAPADGGLGLRGFSIDALDDGLAGDHDLAGSVYLPMNGARGASRAAELGERLLASMRGAAPQAEATGDMKALPLDGDLHDFIAGQLGHGSGGTTAEDSTGGSAKKAAPADREESAAAAVTCMVEYGAYNPGFWNNDATIRSRNNCYNYASNKRTDTFAQPGRGCGHMYSAITCPAVTQASLCDGLHRRFACFPDSEKPRYLVALVVAPGPGFIDFHWYRKQKEGFWGHKPGSTAVRNVDNSGRVILDPQTCNRGPYTQFCGYFYTCRSQRIR